VTSHRGTSATVLRVPDRPACSGGADQPIRPAAAGRRGSRMSPAFLGRGYGTGRRGDRHRTGAEAQEALRRLMLRDQAGSMNHPFYN
jgi:hypothetical protein